MGATLCAYLVVLQAALGGLASAGHAGGSPNVPFEVICLNAPDGAADDLDDRPADHRGCCTLGCVTAAIAPASEPDPRPFAYDPRPTPRRVAGEDEARRPSDAFPALKRPRGPPTTI